LGGIVRGDFCTNPGFWIATVLGGLTNLLCLLLDTGTDRSRRLRSIFAAAVTIIFLCNWYYTTEVCCTILGHFSTNSGFWIAAVLDDLTNILFLFLKTRPTRRLRPAIFFAVITTIVLCDHASEVGCAIRGHFRTNPGFWIVTVLGDLTNLLCLFLDTGTDRSRRLRSIFAAAVTIIFLCNRGAKERTRKEGR
jgi:Ni/Fe-hydrogenase subunit HybB-like protein